MKKLLLIINIPTVTPKKEDMDLHFQGVKDCNAMAIVFFEMNKPLSVTAITPEGKIIVIL